jgi:hypothetical protein
MPFMETGSESQILTIFLPICESVLRESMVDRHAFATTGPSNFRGFFRLFGILSARRSHPL